MLRIRDRLEQLLAIVALSPGISIALRGLVGSAAGYVSSIHGLAEEAVVLARRDKEAGECVYAYARRVFI